MKLGEDLTKLNEAITHLSGMCGLKHPIENNEDVLKKFLPLRIEAKVLEGKMECEEIVKTSDLTIVKVFSDRETVCPVHNHPDFQIIYCCKNETWIALAGKLEHLNPGEHLIIAPNINHGTYLPHGGELLVITFPPDTSKPIPDCEV